MKIEFFNMKSDGTFKSPQLPPKLEWNKVLNAFDMQNYFEFIAEIF